MLKIHTDRPAKENADSGLFDLFELILYVPVNNFSVMSGRVFLG